MKRCQKLKVQKLVDKIFHGQTLRRFYRSIKKVQKIISQTFLSVLLWMTKTGFWGTTMVIHIFWQKLVKV